MNILFFGSSGFSVPALRSVASKISCVVTKRAKPKGRGYMLEDNEVKRAAEDLGLPVIEIDSFKDETALALKDMRPDLFVTASFGLIVPKWALEIPIMGPVNVHPSLLPRYRGPSPMQWALLNGDKETGITLIRMSEKMDAGNILYQEKAAILEDDDAVSLSERLSRRVGEILPQFVERVESDGLAEGSQQDEEEATYTAIIAREMGRIEWGKSASEICGQVKAFALWPVAYTYLDGLLLKVFRVTASSDRKDGKPGTIVQGDKQGMTVVTGSGLLRLEEVQLENRKRMKAHVFAQGYRGLIGKVLG